MDTPLIGMPARARLPLATLGKLTLLLALLFSIRATTPMRASAAPGLLLGSYLGGAGDDAAQAVAVDAQGNLLIAGWTYSTAIPATSGSTTDRDLFVTKLDPSGSHVLYSTILGGSKDDSAYALAVDPQGNAWVTGETASPDFPTKNTFWPYKGGYDTFVAKLSPTGEVLASSFLGEPNADKGNAIAVDRHGDAYVVGEIPLDYGPAVLIAKISASGSELVYRGYFGQAQRGFLKGSRGLAAAVDASGQLYIAGTTDSIAFEAEGLIKRCVTNDGLDCTRSDAFVVVVNPAGTRITASTLLGGSQGDEATGVAFDTAGDIYISGSTFSSDFPLREAWQSHKRGSENFSDGFVAKLTPQLDQLIYATYYGGTAWDEPRALSVNTTGTVVIAGLTSSNDLAVPGAIQERISGLCLVDSNERYCYDGFAASFAPSGQLNWATYLGGTLDDTAQGVLARADGVYMVGRAESAGLPTTAGVVQPAKALNADAFVVRLGLDSQPPPPGPHRVSLPLVVR
jgi:hypothetical protein